MKKIRSKRAILALQALTLSFAFNANFTHAFASEKNSFVNTVNSEINRNSKINSESGHSENYSKDGSSVSFYLIGPGDALNVEILDVPEYSGIFSVGPDGTLYLPRLRSLLVEGLTVEELKYFLTKEFSAYIREPQVFINIVGYRPIRVYIGGEVQRPGYYYLSGQQQVTNAVVNAEEDEESNLIYGGTKINQSLRLPTIFDALRTAGGVTPFSKLSDVAVTRNRPLGYGGGKMRAHVNFLKVITQEDESQNLRLFDGDSIYVTRSATVLREQIIKAGQTNLSPDFVNVYVTGRVRDPGLKKLPQGATLDQALASAGGQRLLRGQVEFIRFNRDGTTDKRKFFVGGANPSGSYKNPVLMPGDVIRVNNSPLSATVTVLNELTAPAVGIYSVYSLFK